MALSSESELHAPVLGLVDENAPGPEFTNLRTMLTATAMPLEPKFELVDPTVAGLDPDRLEAALSAVRYDVRMGRMPGAAIVVGRRGQVAEKRGFGVLAPGLGPVDPDGTIYDLASLTKVVATTSAVMLLVEDGKMEVDAPVSRYLPEFGGGAKGNVTIRHLLTHTSGLPAGVAVPRDEPEEALRKLIATPLRRSPGREVVYSDVGPIVLFAAAERVAGEPLPALLERRVFRPLGMKDTGFHPPEPCVRCAPTTSSIRGTVHDPTAQRLGGTAGNAGLFSTATDIGRFAAMMANDGVLEGVRIFREETIREFTKAQPGARSRALGWERPGPRRNVGSSGSLFSRDAYGHTGFTGTSIWIDPDRGTWVVLLSNRTYDPGARYNIQALRRTVHDRIAEAFDVAIAD